MKLSWIKCQGNVWCKLQSVNLSHRHFDNLSGVYLIWHGGPNPRVVYVGRGSIRERLQSHRANPEILRFSEHGLYVTWARVEPDKQANVEAYLASTWAPRVGHRHPEVSHVPVNSPWG